MVERSEVTPPAEGTVLWSASDYFQPETFGPDLAEALRRDLPAIWEECPAFHEQWGDRILPPLVLRGEVDERIRRDLAAFSDLSLTIVDRFFGGDPLLLGESVGVTPEVIRVLAEAQTELQPTFRADIVPAEDGPKLVEVNWGSRLGGYDLDVLHEQAKVEARSAHGVNTTRHLADAIRAASGNVEKTVTTVLVVCGGAVRADTPFMRSIVEQYRTQFRDVRLHDLSNVEAALRGVPTDRFVVLVRYFQVDDLLDDPHARAAITTFIAGCDSGRGLFWSSMSGAVFASKGFLSTLHSLKSDGRLDDDEAALVDRLIPWTRDVRALPDTWSHAAEQIGLRREEIVLKAKRDLGGNGVIFGRERSDIEFEGDWARARATDSVVQKVVEPVTLDLHADPRAWRVVLGSYMTPSGPAGHMIRARPADEGLLVAASNSDQSRVGGVTIR